MISEIAQSRMVRPYSLTSFAGDRPIIRPEMIAAISMPVPVNESHVNENTAPSGVGFGATGCTAHRADLLDVLAAALPSDAVTLGARCIGVTTDERDHEVDV